MELFKDAQAHANLVADLETVGIAFQDAKTRVAEKRLESLIENLCEEIHLNLTNQAAIRVAQLSAMHPDSDISDLIDFLIFKNAAKVESAKDFIIRTGNDTIDENIVAQVRVYPGDFFIEVCEGNIHCLTIENRSWSQPETSLEAMELELFKFSTSLLAQNNELIDRMGGH